MYPAYRLHLFHSVMLIEAIAIINVCMCSLLDINSLPTETGSNQPQISPMSLSNSQSIPLNPAILLPRFVVNYLRLNDLQALIPGSYCRTRRQSLATRCKVHRRFHIARLFHHRHIFVKKIMMTWQIHMISECEFF
jgi:hypothetical protein